MVQINPLDISRLRNDEDFDISEGGSGSGFIPDVGDWNEENEDIIL